MRSAIGYVDNPGAIYTRGLASGLAARGHDVRLVEPRGNADYVATLRAVGGDAARQFHRDFANLQHHTFDMRRGGRLLEWTARELALLDVAVAVDGVDEELCRWIANITRDGLLRVFVSFDPAGLTAESAERLQLALLDARFATEVPDAPGEWLLIDRSIAAADIAAGVAADALAALEEPPVDPVDAARQFESQMDTLKSQRLAPDFGSGMLR